MKLFQILSHLGLIVLLVVLFANRSRKGLSSGVLALWATLFIVGIITILFPQITKTAANILGIGRGADLVFYLGIIAMGAGFFATYLRMCKLERNITELTRHLAIQGAETPQSDSKTTNT